MAAQANPLGRNPNYAAPIPIEEDSDLTNTLCNCPIFGVLFSIFRDKSMISIIHQTDDVPSLIELIDIRNKHMSANLRRDLNDIALLTTGVALGVFDAHFSCLAILQVVNYPMQIAVINHNEKVKKALLETRDSGLREQIW